MQAIIFIGIQATGKSTFYKTFFFNSHVRISLDLLNTRNKENLFLDTCLRSQSKFVVDNTNPTRNERRKYIELARTHNYEITGYYFSSSLEEAIMKNKTRKGKEKIPDIGIRNTYKKLEIPSYEEGFDQLYFVSIGKNGYITQEWKNEI